MENLKSVQSYADLRRHVSPEAFTAAMNYLAWHNRLKMTAMLPVRQALVVAFLCEKRQIDERLYRSIKAFLDEHGSPMPERIDDCRQLARELATYLQN